MDKISIQNSLNELRDNIKKQSYLSNLLDADSKRFQISSNHSEELALFYSYMLLNKFFSLFLGESVVLNINEESALSLINDFSQEIGLYLYWIKVKKEGNESNMSFDDFLQSDLSLEDSLLIHPGCIICLYFYIKNC